MVCVAVIVNVPFAFGVFLAETPRAALACMIVPFLLGNFWQGVSLAHTQGLVELRMRAVAAAVLLFIVNIIGLGAGPQFVGIVSDLLRATHGQDSLRYALLLCSGVNLWAAFHYYLAGRALPAEAARLRRAGRAAPSGARKVPVAEADLGLLLEIPVKWVPLGFTPAECSAI
jgi:hypothetical protein